MHHQYGHHHHDDYSHYRGPGDHREFSDRGEGRRMFRGEYAEPEFRGGPRGFGPRSQRGGPGPRPGFGFGGFRGEFAGRSGPRANRGDVRNSILVLLGEEPRHGYELIQVIEERTGGMWKPSPGSIYPTLQAMEDEGLIVSSDRNGKKVFSLTEDGQAAAERLSSENPPWESGANDPRAVFHGLRKQIGGLATAVMQVAQNGSADQLSRVQEMLSETRRAIYRILAEEDGGDL